MSIRDPEPELQFAPVACRCLVEVIRESPLPDFSGLTIEQGVAEYETWSSAASAPWKQPGSLLKQFFPEAHIDVLQPNHEPVPNPDCVGCAGSLELLDPAETRILNQMQEMFVKNGPELKQQPPPKFVALWRRPR